MSLFGALVTGFVPSARGPEAATYRRLARETGRYGTALDGYAPYRAAHEPPDRTSTTQRAAIVHDLVMAAEAERLGALGALTSFGKAPRTW